MPIITLPTLGKIKASLITGNLILIVFEYQKNSSKGFVNIQAIPEGKTFSYQAKEGLNFFPIFLRDFRVKREKENKLFINVYDQEYNNVQEQTFVYAPSNIVLSALGTNIDTNDSGDIYEITIAEFESRELMPINYELNFETSSLQQLKSPKSVSTTLNLKFYGNGVEIGTNSLTIATLGIGTVSGSITPTEPNSKIKVTVYIDNSLTDRTVVVKHLSNSVYLITELEPAPPSPFPDGTLITTLEDFYEHIGIVVGSPIYIKDYATNKFIQNDSIDSGYVSFQVTGTEAKAIILPDTFNTGNLMFQILNPGTSYVAPHFFKALAANSRMGTGSSHGLRVKVISQENRTFNFDNNYGTSYWGQFGYKDNLLDANANPKELIAKETQSSNDNQTFKVESSTSTNPKIKKGKKK